MTKRLPNAKVRQLELMHNIEVPTGSKFFPGTDTPIPEGIRIRSRKGVEVDFMYQGVRRTETIRGLPTVGHVLKAAALRQRVIQAIGLGLFNYAAEFPNSRKIPRTEIAEKPRQVPTIGEALDAWLATVRGTVGKNAFIDYSKDIKGQLKTAPLHALAGSSHGNARHPAGLLADLPVNELTPEGISSLRSWFLDRPVSVKRVMNILIPLRGAMAQLAADPKQTFLDEDPFERVRPLKREKALAEPASTSRPNDGGITLSIEQVARFQEDEDRPDPFTPDEISAFMQHMSAPFVHLVQFWLWTGLRTGELIALQWRDIDWNRGEICIRYSVSRGIFKETKSNRMRWVKMLPLAREALRAQFNYSGQGGTYVFLNPYTNSRWANESKIRDRFKEALAKAGVRYRRPYHCRHTYASTLLSAGESTLFVAEQLGHRDWNMVMRHYGRWIPKVDSMAGSRAAHSIASVLSDKSGALAAPTIAPSAEGGESVHSSQACAETDDGSSGKASHKELRDE